MILAWLKKQYVFWPQYRVMLFNVTYGGYALLIRLQWKHQRLCWKEKSMVCRNISQSRQEWLLPHPRQQTHEVLIQFWFNAGPMLYMLIQHQTNTGSMHFLGEKCAYAVRAYAHSRADFILRTNEWVSPMYHIVPSADTYHAVIGMKVLVWGENNAMYGTRDNTFWTRGWCFIDICYDIQLFQRHATGGWIIVLLNVN